MAPHMRAYRCTPTSRGPPCIKYVHELWRPTFTSNVATVQDMICNVLKFQNPVVCNEAAVGVPSAGGRSGAAASSTAIRNNRLRRGRDPNVHWRGRFIARRTPSVPIVGRGRTASTTFGRERSETIGTAGTVHRQTST
jgi:hypothetical protein